MYDRILFPTDGNSGSRYIVDHVLDIVAFHGATLHVLNVGDTIHDSVTRIGTNVIDTLPLDEVTAKYLLVVMRNKHDEDESVT